MASSEAKATETKTAAKGQAQAVAPKLKWDTSNMSSVYANVCNVNSTQEEMVFLFGVNEAWDAEMGELKIQLTNRVVMSPYAAKRLSLILNNVVEGYESRFGELKIEQKPAVK